MSFNFSKVVLSWDVDGNLIFSDQRCRSAWCRAIRKIVSMHGLEVTISNEELLEFLEEAAPGTGWPLFSHSATWYLLEFYGLNVREASFEIVFNELWLRDCKIPAAISSLQAWSDVGVTNVVSTGSDLPFISHCLGEDVMSLFEMCLTRSTPHSQPKPSQAMADTLRSFAGDRLVIHIGDTGSDVTYAERAKAVPVIVPHAWSTAGLRDSRCIALRSHKEFLPTNESLLAQISAWTFA
jgi:phosphoglycolate phosphatase-like HAD superfamily hydrolase